MNSRDHQAHAGQYSRKQRNNNHYYHHKSYQHGPVKQLSKQQFLQANCQFVVIGGHGYDYSVHLRNPDLTVPWEYIEQVRFRQTGSTEIICPICLSLPSAAQITKCGHIFCFSCVLHYLAVNDDKKCPVCFGPLRKDDLKSVVTSIQPSVSVGDEIHLRLMHRNKGSIEVEPYLGCNGSDLESHGQAYNQAGSLLSHDHHQANLIVVNPIDVVEQVTSKEREELLWKHEENEESEICFVEQAMDILNQRLDKLHRMAQTCSPKPHELHNNPAFLNEPPAPTESTKSYLFYQSNSEFQHIYLNPFCTRILCHQFGRLEDCPQEIAAKIVGLECVSMNEACRKRFKYLEHLPLSCEFRLIEIDVKDLVSAETYEYFKPQIISREKERERRRMEDQKRDKIIEVQQNRRIYGIMPALDISLDSREQFPAVSEHLDSSRAQESQDPSEEQEATPVLEEPAATEQPPTPEVNHLSSARPMSSFEAIQMQEEREALMNRGNTITTNRASGSWGAKSNAPTQSSFAKLLVDAREKKWTKNVTTTNRSQSSSQVPPSQSSFVSPLSSSTMDPEEEEEEQLPAPPNNFTISDYLESNVTFSKKSRKPKKNGAKN